MATDADDRKTFRRILIVEDVKSISNFICRQIESKLGMETVSASSFAETKEILTAETDFFISLLDLNLPDAPDGEIVDYVLSKKIPSVVLTATFDEKVREDILNKNVIDYMIKDGLQSLKHINDLIRRIYRNQYIKVLVVDDSRGFRNYYRKLLTTHKFNVVEAEDGIMALATIDKNPDTRMVITDYNMPKMDGFELVSRLRKKYDKNELAIIGISAQGGGLLSAKFLKSGANDFLTKPFEREEFYARVSQNIEVLEYISELKETATRDPLTKLYNRRYYFEKGDQMFTEYRKKNRPVAVGMVDIDFFKKINDTLGHDAGDNVLKFMSGVLTQAFDKPHIVARFGGEEFCILVCGLDDDKVYEKFENLRVKIENSEIVYHDQVIRMTVSVGIANQPRDTMETMINRADQLLYSAKDEGRNRVVSE